MLAESHPQGLLRIVRQKRDAGFTSGAAETKSG